MFFTAIQFLQEWDAVIAADSTLQNAAKSLAAKGAKGKGKAVTKKATYNTGSDNSDDVSPASFVLSFF